MVNYVAALADEMLDRAGKLSLMDRVVSVETRFEMAVLGPADEHVDRLRATVGK